MRLKVIPLKVPPNYLSVYSDHIQYDDDFRQRGQIDENHIVETFSTSGLFPYKYDQIDLRGFVIDVINRETRESFSIPELKTNSNVEIQCPYWFPPDSENLFSTDLDSLEPVLAYLNKHPYLNDLYRDLNAQVYFPINQRIIKDLFSDSLAQKTKQEGDHFFLLQVILIKLIYFIFQIEYGNWDFTTNNTRVLNYFEYLNPNLINNIDSNVVDRNIHNLPVPENCFLLRRKHLYLNQDRILPVIDIKKYLQFTDKEQNSFYNIFKFRKDTRFTYCNYNPERDLALLLAEIRNGEESTTVFVFCKFDHLKYQTRCGVVPDNERGDECYRYMDINSDLNNINFLNLINRKTLGVSILERGVLGLSKSNIVSLIRKSGLKFNKENYPSVFNTDWVSDQGEIIYRNRPNEPVTVIRQIKENQFWNPHLRRYVYTRDRVLKDGEDRVINRHISGQRLIGFEVEDRESDRRHPVYHIVSSDSVSFPNSYNINQFHKSMKNVYIYNSNFTRRIWSSSDFKPLRADIIRDYINPLSFSLFYKLKLIPYYMWILLYCDLFNNEVMKQKKNRMILSAETDSDITDEIRPNIIDSLEKEGVSRQAGPSSGWLSKRSEKYQKHYDQYSDKMIKPYLEDNFVYDQSYEPYHYG